MKFRPYLLIPLIFSACTQADIKSTAAAAVNKVATSISVEQAISDATEANKKAKSIGHEWRDTAKIIKKAKKAAKAGDDSKAIKLANKAEFQGKAAYAQGIEQKDAGPASFLK